MKVSIQLGNPVRNGCFADVKLSVTDVKGTNRVLDLYIDFEHLKDFSNDTCSVAFDFFLVSCLVYGVDNLLERYQFSIDGWAREIEVTFPVNNLEVWAACRSQFGSLLTFLTGDYWNISFAQISGINFFTDRARRRHKNRVNYEKEKYAFASLFSGGLDSLVGVIDGLSELPEGSKALMLSHFDSSSPGPNSDQKAIAGAFNRDASVKGKFDWIQCTVALRNKDRNGQRWRKESSFRSRSLLFIGIALLCIETLPNCNTLTIPENGTISLNYPLTPSRCSTLSTRTTHPHYLSELQALLGMLGLSTVLHNPYQSRTKGELVQGCRNLSLLKDTYSLSVSCGKRGRKMHWDTKTGTQHCGICMPCIYRRAALHRLSLDNQLYGIDLFTTPNQIFHKYDFPALFDFLDNGLTTEKIRRTLLVNGSLPFDEIEGYASLVTNVRAEIKDWVRAKGNRKLRALAHT